MAVICHPHFGSQGSWVITKLNLRNQSACLRFLGEIFFAVARLACEVGQNKGYKQTIYSDLRYGGRTSLPICVQYSI
jgi:hypothetical protein